MRLASFVEPDEPSVVRTGVIVDDEVVDLTDPAVGLPGTMTDFLVAGPAAIERAADALRSGARRLALDHVHLRPPVPHPVKVLGIGLNYAAHVAETGASRPEHQVWFNKQRTCVIGPGETIEIPEVSDQVDYEGELAMVIGRRCKLPPALAAMIGVALCFGLRVVSVWQHWNLPKAIDYQW